MYTPKIHLNIGNEFLRLHEKILARW